MQLSALSGPIYALCVWFYRLAYLNVLWIVFTVLGLGIFGFFPATIALLATMRQFINQHEIPVMKTFWTYYKKEFLKSNSVGLCILLMATLLISNVQFLQATGTSFSNVLYAASIITGCFLLLVVCYFLSLYVEYKAPLKTHLKNAVLLAVYNPLASLMMIFGFLAVYLSVIFVSGLGIFFSVSVMGMVVLSSARIAFRRVEKYQ